jgi:hypothetical protein
MHSNPKLRNKSTSLPLLIAIVAFAALAIEVQASAQKIIKIDAPGAGTAAGQGTQANGVNAEGTVTGFYLDAYSAFHGFLRTPDGRFTTFNAPGSGTGYYQGTGAWGITPSGAIAGDYVDVNCLEHGYILEHDGRFITFEAPTAGRTPISPCMYIGEQGTTPGAINPRGEIAGIILDRNNVYHGFVRTLDGKVTTFDPAGAGTGPFQGTWVSFAAGLAANGTAAGWYIDETYTYHGYVRTPDGRISTFDGPGEGVQGTLAASCNSQGTTVGSYLDAGNLWHGFLRTKEGKITTIDVPYAATGAYDGTQLEAMNDEGIIAGNYIDANGANHGFVLAPAGRITKIEPPGAGPGAGQGTVPYSVGVTGSVTGYFYDANGVEHGFLWKP